MKKYFVLLTFIIILLILSNCTLNKYSDENIKRNYSTNAKIFNKIVEDFINKNEITEYCVFSDNIPDDLKSDLEKLDVQCVYVRKTDKNSNLYIKFTLFGFADSECGIIYDENITNRTHFDSLIKIEKDWYIYRDD